MHKIEKWNPILDYLLLTALTAGLFWGGMATLGCGTEDVPGGSVVDGQTGVNPNPQGGITFDKDGPSSALYRVPRYATLSDGSKAEYTWSAANKGDMSVEGQDPSDPDSTLLRINKTVLTGRTVFLRAEYQVGDQTRVANKDVMVLTR